MVDSTQVVRTGAELVATVDARLPPGRAATRCEVGVAVTLRPRAPMLLRAEPAA